MGKTNKIRSLKGRTAFVVEVEEISRRSIIIYDDIKSDFKTWDAVDAAEELCNAGTINLDHHDFQTRNCNVVRAATEGDLNDIEAFHCQQTSEYCAANKQHMLISVCDRSISTSVHSSFAMARAQMLKELETEYLKKHSKSQWAKFKNMSCCSEEEFSFTETSAWSNIDDDMYCDWEIVPVA